MDFWEILISYAAGKAIDKVFFTQSIWNQIVNCLKMTFLTVSFENDWLDFDSRDLRICFNNAVRKFDCTLSAINMREVMCSLFDRELSLSEYYHCVTYFNMQVAKRPELKAFFELQQKTIESIKQCISSSGQIKVLGLESSRLAQVPIDEATLFRDWFSSVYKDNVCIITNVKKGESSIDPKQLHLRGKSYYAYAWSIHTWQRIGINSETNNEKGTVIFNLGEPGHIVIAKNKLQLYAMQEERIASFKSRFYLDYKNQAVIYTNKKAGGYTITSEAIEPLIQKDVMVTAFSVKNEACIPIKKSVISDGTGLFTIEFSEDAHIVFTQEQLQRWVVDGYIRNDKIRVGRNDPCPCGSGKRYKNCCGKNN